MDHATTEIAALGRALHPGMLYDCRRDCAIPGVNLWDKSTLKVEVKAQPFTDVQFSSSNSLRDKASLLNVNASLKASFLGGLVQVGGSAKYLCDQTSSASQSRITMQHIQNTRFEELTMKNLSNIPYPEVFDHKTATHVITAVLYGTHVFMVFDKTTSEDEDKKKIEGTLRAIVQKIPSLSVEGKASVKLNEEEKNLVDNINCTFYGDCKIDENPTTYMEALQLYKKLPSLLEERKNEAVPVKVWLYPLYSLNNKAAKLEREINEALISEIEGALEDLADVDRRCKDLAKNKIAIDFLNVRDRLQTFQGLLTSYKLLLQKALRKALPAIRGGEEDEKVMDSIVHIHQTSPFRPKNLRLWLDNLQSEVELLNTYTSEMSTITSTITSPKSLSSVLSFLKVDTVVCFSFTSLKDQDPFLSSLTPMVDTFEKLASVSISHDLETEERWFTNPEIITKMKENVSLFKEFFEANKNDKKTKFIIATIPDSFNPGATIRLYKRGKMIDNNFQPVSKPPSPSVDILDRDVILRLQRPSTGETVQFRVEYMAKKPDAAGNDAEDWVARVTPDAQECFKLTGLELANEHWVRYRAVSDVGVSESSDPVPLSLQGKVNVSVGQSWNWTATRLCNNIRTKLMTSLGMSRWSLSTIESEVTNQVSNVSIPYCDTNPGGLRPGMAWYIQGVVHPAANEFTIDHLCSDGIAFHFKLFFKYGYGVCDSCRNNIWQKAETPKNGCPLSAGSAFDLFIVITAEGYEVYINGQRFCFFGHRVPVENVTMLSVHGDLSINTMGTVENWSASTFGKEQSRESSRGKYSDTQSGVAHPVCNPSKPYKGPITGGLKPGLLLFFQGIVPSDASRFSIDLMVKDSDNIAFHFNARVGTPSVVRNSCEGGRWNSPEETHGGPFVKGGAFDMFMVVKPESYEVIVNGHFYCEFRHRISLETVSWLIIGGDVFMNTFGIFEVDKVQMKVVMPAHLKEN